jgi:hypothetical protein
MKNLIAKDHRNILKRQFKNNHIKTLISRNFRGSSITFMNLNRLIIFQTKKHLKTNLQKKQIDFCFISLNSTFHLTVPKKYNTINLAQR